MAHMENINMIPGGARNDLINQMDRHLLGVKKVLFYYGCLYNLCDELNKWLENVATGVFCKNHVHSW